MHDCNPCPFPHACLAPAPQVRRSHVSCTTRERADSPDTPDRHRLACSDSAGQASKRSTSRSVHRYTRLRTLHLTTQRETSTSFHRIWQKNFLVIWPRPPAIDNNIAWWLCPSTGTFKLATPYCSFGDCSYASYSVVVADVARLSNLRFVISSLTHSHTSLSDVVWVRVQYRTCTYVFVTGQHQANYDLQRNTIFLHMRYAGTEIVTSRVLKANSHCFTLASRSVPQTTSSGNDTTPR